MLNVLKINTDCSRNLMQRYKFELGISKSLYNKLG